MSSDAPIIGIDLGTTNSVVSYTDEAGITHVVADETGARIVPSVVQFTAEGDVVVGSAAKAHAQVEPDRVASVFKRGMGEPGHLDGGAPFVVDGRSQAPEELSSYVLKKLAAMAEQHLGRPPEKAVVTVPAYFGETERTATRNAAEIAGLEIVQIIDEPTAAAIAHGLDGGGSVGGLLLVFDLGGGTFDVTIMRYEDGGEMHVVATEGDKALGGADFDAAIVERMRAEVRSERGIDLLEDPYQRADAYAAAEELKKQLSTAPSVTRRIVVGGPPVLFELTREQFEELIAEQRELVEDATRSALDKAAEQLGVDTVRVDAALMVGGSSRIPAFRRLLTEITGLEPLISKNLDEDVSRGAAMLGAKLAGRLDPRSELAAIPVPRDAASHALGITLAEEDGVTEYNDVVIPEGTPIPHEISRIYGTASDGQTEIRVRLNEGGDRDLMFVRELGESVGRLSRPVPRGYPLRMEIEYTADQLVVVNAYDGETGEHLCELKVEHRGILDEEAKRSAREHLTSIAVR